MHPTTTDAPGRVLLAAAADGATGALTIGSRPGGVVYLVDGHVTYAESPAAPGVGELLTTSGRLAGRVWRAALETGGPAGAVGPLLVERGHLTRGELELCLLGAVYDAASFALRPTAAPATFTAGVRHWIGPVVRIDPVALEQEARRRAALLDRIHPDARVDAAPVVPAPRAPRERLTLTAGQWELLMHADGQRTAADLAQLLGRAGFATVQEVRRLAALGLLQPPRPERDRRPTPIRPIGAAGPSVPARRPGPEPPAAVTVDLRNRLRVTRSPGAGGATSPGAGGAAAAATAVPAPDLVTGHAATPPGSPVSPTAPPVSPAAPPAPPAAQPVPPAAPPVSPAAAPPVSPAVPPVSPAVPPVSPAVPPVSPAVPPGSPGAAAGASAAPIPADGAPEPPEPAGSAAPAPGARSGRTTGSHLRVVPTVRRVPGAQLPPVPRDPRPAPRPVDDALLRRIRTALRALR